MKILDAFRELVNYYPYSDIVKTQGGHYYTISDAWGEEIMAEDNGSIDPNEYGVNAEKSIYFDPKYPQGIYYKTTGNRYAGMAYEIKEGA